MNANYLRKTFLALACAAAVTAASAQTARPDPERAADRTAKAIGAAVSGLDRTADGVVAGVGEAAGGSLAGLSGTANRTVEGLTRTANSLVNGLPRALGHALVRSPQLERSAALPASECAPR